MNLRSSILLISVLLSVIFLGVNQQNLISAFGQLELKLQDLFQLTSNSVVQITVVDPRTSSQQSLGSGFVYDKSGHIITNNHVVGSLPYQGTSIYLVTFLNGNSYQASLVGNDPYSDLAVLKLSNPEATDLNPLLIGNSSSLNVGDTVVAIGNPFGLSGSLTVGVVSGLGRLLPSSEGSGDPLSQLAPSFQIPNVIQTDAAINPGNSGGPLLNMRGEVIGINSAIYSNTGSYAGIGFAVPSSMIKKVVQSILTTGKYSHPYLGVTGLDITPQLAQLFGLKKAQGFLITDITSNSPASKSELQKGTITYNQRGEIIDAKGDIILAIDDNVVRKIDDILSYLERETKVGDTVTLKIFRNGQLNDITVVLGPRELKTDALGSQLQDDRLPGPGPNGQFSDCYQYLPKSICDLMVR